MRTIDELGGDPSLGDAPGVGALEVVEVNRRVQLAVEAAVADLQKARERRSPALIEQCAVEALDVTVGLRAAGLDSAVPDVESGERLGENRPAELVAIVCEHGIEFMRSTGTREQEERLARSTA